MNSSFSLEEFAARPKIQMGEKCILSVHSTVYLNSIPNTEFELCQSLLIWAYFRADILFYSGHSSLAPDHMLNCDPIYQVISDKCPEGKKMLTSQTLEVTTSWLGCLPDV